MASRCVFFLLPVATLCDPTPCAPGEKCQAAEGVSLLQQKQHRTKAPPPPADDSKLDKFDLDYVYDDNNPLKGYEHKKHYVQHRETVTHLYRALDRDHDEQISWSEFRMITEDDADEYDVRLDDLPHAFTQIDVDNSGKITMEEMDKWTQGIRMKPALPLMGRVAYLDTYPGYDGKLNVRGKVNISVKHSGMVLSWDMSGTEDVCTLAYTSSEKAAKNGCGLHVHSGDTCGNATAVGGHYFDKDFLIADPWGKVVYHTANGTSVGAASLKTGKSLPSVMGHSFVVHDHMGKRISCGIIEPVYPAEAPKSSSMALSPKLVLLLAISAMLHRS